LMGIGWLCHIGGIVQVRSRLGAWKEWEG
jgi:hypothetical protein